MQGHSKGYHRPDLSGALRVKYNSFTDIVETQDEWDSLRKMKYVAIMRALEFFQRSSLAKLSDQFPNP